MSNSFARGFKTWCENVAVQQRRGLGLAPSDPIEPHRLATQLGATVWYGSEIPHSTDWKSILLEEDPDCWSAFTLHSNGKPLIILNPAHRTGRESSDLMHELAHILIGHQPARMSVSEDGLLLLNTYDRKQEDEADWLGGCLLLPRAALLHIRAKRLGTPEAAKHYGVSQHMLRWRVDVSGVDYQLGIKKRRSS